MQTLNIFHIPGCLKEILGFYPGIRNSIVNLLPTPCPPWVCHNFVALYSKTSVVLQTSPIQLKYKVSHIYMVKLSSSQRKRKKEKESDGINFNNIFYLSQYIKKILLQHVIDILKVISKD